MAESKDKDARSAAADVRVLIVDNDKALAHTMTESLERVGYPCTTAFSGKEGVKAVQQDTFDVIFTDLVMSDVDGMEVLAETKEALPDSEVIVVTGHASVAKAVEAMQQGAFSFLEKPVTPDKLRAVAEKASEKVQLKRQNLELAQRLDEKFGFEGIIFTSKKMQELIDRLKRVAPTDATVLITGENGTGKDLVAQAVHQNSPRKSKRFVGLNAGAVAENLVESELFGHVKGAFTDAVTDREGAFQYADGGTLFLDEIGDMPAATQIKLLRVLENQTITRVGDNKPIKVNVRVISATNRDLAKAIEDSNFREDLYYRLKVITVHMPALRERREDIVPLTDHFRKLLAKHHNKTIKSVSPAVTRTLVAYDWPGNVRQLRNAVETMVIYDNDGTLDVDDLPPDLAAIESPAPEPGGGPSHLVGQPMDAFEKFAIEQTLQLTNGNREEAAKILEIGARTLYRKLDKYELE
jgi:two-component system response regulator HydG